MSLHKSVIDPILRRLDSEKGHVAAVEMLHFLEAGPIRRRLLRLLAGSRVEDPRLRTTVGDVELENPLLVGAGWDKKGRAVRALHEIGFAGVEVGSVLEHPQPGNPKPRQFMIGDGVSLNRLGFNSPGMEAVAQNLERYAHDEIPIGISLGKNKDVEAKDAPEAHAAVVRRLADRAAYFAVNVSSPNTPGLRSLQEKGPLTDILAAVRAALEETGRDTDIFVKIAPDLTLEAVDDVVDVAVAGGIAGIIASNTTIRPELKAKYGERWRGEAGGLSGDDAEFRAMSTRQIAHIHRQASDELDVIGVGGVKDTATALEKIRAGASAVQLVTAMRSEGLGVANAVNRGILQWMDRYGINEVTDLRGIDAGDVIRG
jgi:dihydroorotate dehydrogenase